MSRFLTKTCSLMLLATLAVAQEQGRAHKFDAASVRIIADDGRGIMKTLGPNARAMRGGPGSGDPGRMVWGAVTLRELFTRAWDVDYTRIVGPDWLARQTIYRVEATMPADTARAEFQSMLQNLLIERFRLRIHREIRMYPGYELVVAPGGPKLTPAADHSEWPPPSAGAVDSKGCPILRDNHHEFSAVWRTGGVCVTYESTSMRDFSQSTSLIGYARLPDGTAGHIVDKTGLTGIYDFRLIFDGATGSRPAVAGSRAGEVAPQDEVGSGLPNVFTAVQKQLGLKLQKVNAIPLDTIVIEAGDPVPPDN